jgi:hypothetical protein
LTGSTPAKHHPEYNPLEDPPISHREMAFLIGKAVFCVFSCSPREPFGGVESWAVNVAADPDASRYPRAVSAKMPRRSTLNSPQEICRDFQLAVLLPPSPQTKPVI